MKQALLVVPVLIAAIAGAGCATKAFVKQSVAETDARVDTLTKQMADEQIRVTDNATKLTVIDQKAQVAQTSADQAMASAGMADLHARAAATAATAADGKADALDKASRRLVMTVVLNEAHGAFKTGRTDLAAAVKTRIDAMVAKLLADPQDVYFEIEGYTDSTGTATVNDRLGRARAEAVERYLHTEHQVPLHRMDVFSYGAENPAASNKTAAGRAENRRVVIKVLQ